MKIYVFDIGFVEVPNRTMLNVYVVGCKHNCPGCCNQHLQNFNHDRAKNVTVEGFVENFARGSKLYDGICWLGGDAVFQEKELVLFSAALKERFPNKLVTLYTGFSFSELSKDVLGVVDIVVDGKWNGKVMSDKDTNQKIYVKSNNVFKNIMYDEFCSFDYKNV